MKRLIWLVVFGISFGVTCAFCAGSAEAMRLAEGVNFNNQTEVIAYATALKNNEAVIAQAKQEGIPVDTWIKNTVTEMTNNYRAEQQRKAEEQARLNKITEALTWSSRNKTTGVVLLDPKIQTAILDDYKQNKARGEASAKSYVGKIVEYAGAVTKIENWSGKIVIIFYGSENKGIMTYAFVNDASLPLAMSLNVGNVIVVSGECTEFGVASMSDTPSITIRNSSIRHIIK